MIKFIATVILLLLINGVSASQDQVQKQSYPIKYPDGIATGDFAEVTVTFSVLDEGSTVPSDTPNNTIFPLRDENGVLTNAFVIVTAVVSVPIPLETAHVYNATTDTGQKLQISATNDGSIEILDANGNGTGNFISLNIKVLESE